MMEFRIDSEFKNLFPKPTAEERETLKADIVAFGRVHSPLVVWDEESILVDGHNRWEIINELGWADDKSKYSIARISYPNRDAALAGAYRAQLGRRNVPENTRSYYMGKMYESQKRAVGGTGANRYTKEQMAQNEPTAKGPSATAENLAKELGVGRETVKRAGKFAQGVDAIKTVSPKAAEMVLNGEANVTKGAIMELVGKPESEVKAVAKAIEKGSDLRKKSFPSGNKHEKIDAPAPTISEDVNAVVEYGLDDLLEELDALNADFLRKWGRVLQIHAQLVNDHAAEVATVMNNLVKDFEKMEAF